MRDSSVWHHEHTFDLQVATTPPPPPGQSMKYTTTAISIHCPRKCSLTRFLSHAPDQTRHNLQGWLGKRSPRIPRVLSVLLLNLVCESIHHHCAHWVHWWLERPFIFLFLLFSSSSISLLLRITKLPLVSLYPPLQNLNLLLLHLLLNGHCCRVTSPRTCVIIREYQ